MKVLIVCTQGGHLTEAQYLLPAFEECEKVWVTHESERTKNMPSTYLLPYIGTNPFIMLKTFFLAWKVLNQEKPDVLFSTGAEVAIPFFVLAKLKGLRSIYLETWTRVDNPTRTARIVYPLADLFLVQWEKMLEKFGPKAKYYGGIL